MLKELSLVDFINEVDKKTPTPGGGSVSALAASLGVALSKMVGHLTIHKKKFKNLEADIQENFMDVLHRFESYKESFVSLIDLDTQAYNTVMTAYKLPKDTDEEQVFRSQEIQKATMLAIETPKQIATLSLDALKHFDVLLQYGNTFALSDLGVSALMLYAGLEGACLNVLINLPSLENEDTKKDLKDWVKQALFEGQELRKDILQQIHQSL
jgi:formiminotetrahydrofolate cyclodeaminase